MMKDLSESSERFCFILGSGASVESGIPSGSTLEMQWMDCLMGKMAVSYTHLTLPTILLV